MQERKSGYARGTAARARGFTLIELLVVIAIIGILSAVVLASLSTARTKGNDAAIQSDLNTVRTQMELYAATNGNYGTAQTPVAMTAALAYSSTGNSAFTADQVVVNAMNGAYGLSGSGNMQYAVGVSGATYAVYAKLTSSANYFCVDSNGSAMTKASAPTLGGGTAAAKCQ